MSTSDNPAFPETPWSLIAQVRDGVAEKQQAMQQLLERYWQPVAAVLQDTLELPETETRLLVNHFLTGLLNPRQLAELDAKQLRFRDFVKQQLSTFVQEQQTRQDGPSGAGSNSLNLAALVELPPSRGALQEVFDEQWMLLLISRAAQQLQQTSQGHPTPLYELFNAVDMSGEEAHRVQQRLEMNAREFNTILTRARKMFRAYLLAEINEYCAERGQAAEELQWLLH